MSSTENTKNNISYTKAIYVWKPSINEVYNQRIKIIKTIDNNLKLPLVNIIENDNEFILKPRCVVNYPFSNENSIIVWCDIVNTEGICYSKDNRLGFLKEMEKHKQVIESKLPKISFIEKYKIEKDNIDTELLLDELVKLCLGCGIEIDECQIHDNVIEIQNNPALILAACDELLTIRFLFYKLSLKFKFEYQLIGSLKYKFYDAETTSEKGYEAIIKYATKLGNFHGNINQNQIQDQFKNNKFSFGSKLLNMIIIPETVKKFNNGYFIDQRFNSSSDHYAVIFSNINILYNEIKDENTSEIQSQQSNI